MRAEIKAAYTHIWRIASAIARNQIAVRNEKSYLGVLWYVLNPAILFLVMYGVHTHVPLAMVANYALYLAIGLLGFSLFRTITLSVGRSFISMSSLVRNTNVSRFTLALGFLFETLVAHVVELVVLVLVCVYFGIWLNIFLYIIPFVYFVLFAGAVGYIIAVTSVYTKDIHHIWAYVVTLTLFLSPVFYFIPVSARPWFIAYNPVTFFLDSIRSALLGEVYWSAIISLSVAALVASAIAVLVHYSSFGRSVAEHI